MVVPTSLEKKFSDLFLDLAKSYVLKKKIVGSHHPLSIRVEKIGQDIIGALRRELNKLGDGEQTTHLAEFDWEFIVVDEPTTVDAWYVPGGKILVYTGLLNYLQTDATIATIIGHEVGHAVARHTMSGNYLWLPILQLFMSDRFKIMSDLFIRLSVCRRDEIEADYIGLLVSACAGYDPRAAPEVYMKLEYYSPSRLEDYRSAHPHGKKRAELFSQPKVMDGALSIYREALKEKGKDKEEERGYLNILNKFIGILF